MAQVFKLFCFAISVLLLLQLADADENDPLSKSGTESNGQDKEYKAPFLKNIEKIKNSSPVKIAKGLSGIVEEHLSNFSKDFESKLNAEAKKQVNGDNSLIPNFFKNNLILPGKAIAQTSFDTLSQPVGKMLSSIKNTYEEELSKSKQLSDKPVALLMASKSIVENTIGSMFGKAQSIWNLGKNNKAKKSEKEAQ